MASTLIRASKQNPAGAPGFQPVERSDRRSRKREAAQVLFSRSVIDDWSFDAEVLFIAQQRKLKIKEVPVTWHDQAGTKVRLLKDASRSLIGLAKIRLNSASGKYK